MKLYEIASDYYRLLSAIEEGEIPEEAIADTLEAVGGELSEKADNIACMIKNLNAEADAIKAEEAKLAERRKQKEKTVKSMKEYLANNLLLAGMRSLETARNKISFRSSSAVKIDDEAAFIAWAKENDATLLDVKEPTISLSAVKKSISEGSVIEGASIVTRMNLQIK